MRNFPSHTVLLLCSLSWIFTSVSESVTVEVRPDGDATLLCSNYSNSPTQILWFRVVKRSEPNKIASIFDPSKVDSFQNGKFEVTSNISHIFLKIKKVNVSDSGLYFCGFLMQQKTVIVHPTYLDVEVFDIALVLHVILGFLTVFFFMVIIVLVLKMYKSHKGGRQTDDLNYAAVTFHRENNQKPSSESEAQNNAIYSAPVRRTQETSEPAAPCGADAL
uniref:Ig-like domain-containing protein n=1 Tax=Sphaeramia orbicularis TaxID=375764 RepID=A0A673CDS7_9TELE